VKAWEFVMDAWAFVMNFVDCDVFVGCLKHFEVVYVSCPIFNKYLNDIRIIHKRIGLLRHITLFVVLSYC